MTFSGLFSHSREPEASAVIPYRSQPGQPERSHER
jgi:hypothetical protein